MDLNCTQCDYKVINSNKFCRKQFFPRLRTNIQDNSSVNSGLDKLDEFITETQLNSEYCDDIIEWIPYKKLECVEYLTRGGNSEVYLGTWNLSLNTHLTSTVALKAIKDSDNTNDNILNEVN